MTGDGSVFDRLDEDFGWSPRQREVLDLLARGRTNAQVAETLGISLDGAKWHVREVLSKLGVDSREQAAEYWRAYNGWRRRAARAFMAAGAIRWSLAGLGIATAGVVVVALLVGRGGNADPGVQAGFAEPEPTPPPGRTVAPPAEEIVLMGTVDRVVDKATFIGSSDRYSAISVDISSADPVYPTGHTPREGDTFAARGGWSRAVGSSTFVVEFVDFNTERWRGELTPVPGERGVYRLYSQRRLRYDPMADPWRTIVVRAGNLDFAAMGSDTDAPLEAFETLPSGTGVDVIGWDDRNGRLVVTYIEAVLPRVADPTPQATVLR